MISFLFRNYDFDRKKISELTRKLLPYFGIVLVSVVVGTFSIRIDAFERFYEFSRTHENWELDEIMVVWFFCIVCILAMALVSTRRDLKANKQSQERIRDMARQDLLTGLPNRLFFESELENRLSHARRYAHSLAIVVLDLDHLKPINDLNGYRAGDRIVQDVANRLRHKVRAHDLVARLGGDEFALAITIERDVNELTPFIRRLLSVIAQPITLETQRVNVTASAGLAVFPTDATNVRDLLQHASLAMHESKGKGRNKVTFFNADLDRTHRDFAKLQLDMKRAIRHQEFVPFFQPLISLDDNRLAGFEMLARWDNPEKGILAPGAFLNVVEDMGLIGDMFWSIFRQACKDVRSWCKPLPISVNLSPIQFLDPELGDKILHILDETGLATDRLVLEITENTLINDIDATRKIIKLLREKGVRFSLDDFGAGYASFHHLNQLPFDTIKIDGSFIESFRENADSLKIMSSIIGLCQSLGKKTTAECVEMAEDVRWLKSLGCTYAQGYLYSQPVNAEGAARMVELWSERECLGPLTIDGDVAFDTSKTNISLQ